MLRRNLTARRLLACLVALTCASPACALNVLLVKQNTTLSSSETSRKTQFETWGHTVTTIVDSDTTTNFNTAMAAVDVVYIPTTVDDYEITNKCKTTTKGVVCEERYIDDDMGFSTGTGWDASHTQTQILDNTHAVTTGLSTGFVTIVSSSQSLTMMNPTVSSGMTVLSKQSYTDGNMLGVMEIGATLAGGGTAAGRRVRLPWGGDSFSWSALNSSGLLICQQAIAWAGSGAPKLLLHWKLDESSGTSAADASGNGYTGTVTGTASWIAARRNNGFDFNGSTKIERSSTLGNPTNFTIACWARVDATDSSGADAVSVGDYIVLRPHDVSLSGPSVGFYRGSSTWVSASSATSYVGAGWHHYLATFDDAGNSLKLYIDGVLVATTSTTYSISWSGQGTATRAGKHGNTSTAYDFDGGIDDVRVYNYALSDAQIAEVYGLIAHWKLDESSGSSANDASLANNDATRTGTAGWTAALDGNGHDFDYASGEDYFVAPSNAALDDVQDDDYTVMAYISPSTVPPGSGSANTAAYGLIRKSGWHAGLAYGSDGSFYMEHWLASGPTWVGVGDWSNHAPGRFYHVAGVVSKTNGTLKIYVDGDLISTSTFTAGTSAYDYGTNPWRLGISSPGASTWGHACDGVIDDARIYNRALADDEIAAIAKTGLRGHWKFDETSGTTLSDSSVNGAGAAFAAGTPTRIAAVRDNGLTFSGANSADTDANFDPIPQGSVAFWLRPSAVPSSTQRLLGISDSWEVTLGTTGLLSCDLGAATGIASTTAFTSSAKWRHVVFNYNSIADTYEMYVDGQLEKSGALTGSDQAAGILTFGTRTGSTNYYAGSLDDVRIYGRPLTASEVADIYGLIGHWKMDSGSGTSLVDSSGKGSTAAFNTGTPTWVAAVRSYGLQFSGSNDAITASSVTPPSEGTLAFWFQSDGTPTATERLLGLDPDFEVRQGTDGLVAFDLDGDASGGFTTTTALVEASRWRHLVAVFDSDDDSYQIYIDGELHKSGTSSTALSAPSAAQLSFGTRTGSTQRFSGALDDVRLYNRKLSPAEIYEVFGMTGWYKLDETSGTSATDSTGLGNSGTFSGSPTLGATANGATSQGYAAAFNGANYMQASGLFDSSSSVSASAWVRLDGADSAGADVVSLGDYFRLRLNGGTSGAAVSYYNGSTDVTATVSQIILDTGWHHFAAVLRSGDTLKLYVDGVEAASTAVSGGISYAGRGSNTRIASHGNSGTTTDLTGRIDDVRIFNRAMTPEEVYYLYRGTRINGVRILKWVETR